VRAQAHFALLMAGLASGCGSTGPSNPGADEWGPAMEVGAPVNTTGWEDSGMISPDGTAIYFTYLRIDPITLLTNGVLRVSGPLRPGWPTTPPYDTLGAQLYTATLSQGVWQEPQPFGSPILQDGVLAGDEWVSADGTRLLFTYGAGGIGPAPGIYYSTKTGSTWATPVLASSLGFPFVEGDENPHLTLDEATLFWESSRGGGYGEADLWMSEKSAGVWGTPQNLGATINTPGTEGSPFSFDGVELLYDDKGASGIFRTRRLTGGSWSTPERIIAGAVGDPSLTLTRDLYFVEGTMVAGGWDANLMVARHR
jgi:hypothetical protein